MSTSCSKCDFIGNQEEYFPRTFVKDGKVHYRSYCKKCEKLRKDIWRSKNKDRHNRKSREWYNRNLEKGRGSKKKWRDSNREFFKNYKKTVYREKTNAQTSVRRKRVKRNTPSWLSKEMKKQMRSIYQKCIEMNRESKDKFHVDHIVPLKGKNVSGLHVPWNLEIIKAKDNIIKGNRF